MLANYGKIWKNRETMNEITDIGPKTQAVRDVMPPRFANALVPDFDGYEDLVANKKSLLLTGSVGTGKTHKLLEILMADLIQTHHWSIFGEYKTAISTKNVLKRFYTVTDVLRQIKAEFDQPNAPVIIEQLINTPVLYLDDLGAEKASEWVKEQLYNVINERYNWLRPVVISTNLTVKEIATNYSDRLASRLMEMCSIQKFAGEDRRLKGKV